MPEPEIIDAHYSTEPRRFRMIWADRIGIAVAALFTAALFYLAMAGDDGKRPSLTFDQTPAAAYRGVFSVWGVLEISVGSAIAVWLFLRCVDFVFTGRMRR